MLSWHIETFVHVMDESHRQSFLTFCRTNATKVDVETGVTANILGELFECRDWGEFVRKYLDAIWDEERFPSK